MQSAFEQFQRTLQQTRHLGSLYAVLKQVVPTEDSSDLLRAQWVLLCSALDYYIHELVRLGMLECWMGKRPRTPAFENFKISLKRLPQLSADDLGWLDAEIRQQHAYKTFQQPSNIAEALSLVSEVKLWPKVAEILGLASEDIKRELSRIVLHRNQIAHEMDLEVATSAPRSILAEDVDEALNFVENLGRAIWQALQIS